MNYLKTCSGIVFFLFILCPLIVLAQGTDKNDMDVTVTIIHAGTALNIPGKTPKSEQTLVIKGNRIDTVHDGYLSAEQLSLNTDEVKTLDMKDAFVLPGLIDAHVHLMVRYGKKFRQLMLSGEEKLITGVVNARVTLNAGFTTVADLDAGANSWPVMVLRNAIEAGEIPGPTISRQPGSGSGAIYLPGDL